MQFSNRVNLLSSTLNGMGVDIDDSEKAMTFLNGLPERFDTLISALDAIQTEDFLFFIFVKAKALQEEESLGIRSSESAAQLQAAALLAQCTRSQRPFCTHCKRQGHLESTCLLVGESILI